MSLRRRSALAHCVALCALGFACAEQSIPSQMTVVLETDLALGTELSHVQVELEDAPTSDSAGASRWFQVKPTCAPSGKRQIIGSFGLRKAHAQKTRLRVAGFVETEAGLEQVVVRRVDAVFASDGAGTLAILLAADCAGRSCPIDQSCEAARCRPIAALRADREPDLRVSDCLDALARNDQPVVIEPPPLLADGGAAGIPVPPQSGPDAGAKDATTEESDGAVASDAGAPDDAQRPPDAAPQSLLPDTGPALCSDPAQASSNDVLNCGACARICSDTNIDSTCHAGVCDGRCRNGYGDCNGDKQRDGCEIPLSSASHCGACNNVCPYGICTDYACRGEVARGFFNAVDAAAWQRQGLTAMQVNLPKGKILALGVLTDLVGDDSNTHIRLGLHLEESPSSGVGLPGTTLGYTESIPARRIAASGGAAGGKRGTEGPLVVPYEVKDPGRYWVSFIASGPVAIYTEDAATAIWSWNAPDVAYGAHFPDMFPFPNQAVLAPYIDVYVVLAPSAD